MKGSRAWDRHTPLHSVRDDNSYYVVTASDSVAVFFQDRVVIGPNPHLRNVNKKSADDSVCAFYQYRNL